jgi:hypothetical protein
MDHLKALGFACGPHQFPDPSGDFLLSAAPKVPGALFGRGLFGAIPGLFGAGGHGVALAPLKTKNGLEPVSLGGK